METAAKKAPPPGRTLVVDWRSWLTLAVLTVCWGSSFAAVAISLGGFSPIFVTGARITLAALVIGCLARAVAGPLPREPGFWLWCLPIGIAAMVAPFSLYTWAQVEVASGVVAIYIAATPLFVLVLAHFFVGEKITKRGAAGFLVGFLGVICLIGPSQMGFFGGPSAVREAAALAAAASFAVAAILVKLMPARHHPLHAAAGALICAAVVHAPATGASIPLEAPSAAALQALLALGLFQTSLMQVTRYHLIKRSGAVFASQASFFLPICAVFLGWALLGESLGALDAIGLSLILAGLIFSHRKPYAAPKPAHLRQEPTVTPPPPPPPPLGAATRTGAARSGATRTGAAAGRRLSP